MVQLPASKTEETFKHFRSESAPDLNHIFLVPHKLQGLSMYRFSIVVPLLGSPLLFEATLASILRYRPDACQVIVAHDGSYHDPHGLADEIEFVSTTQPTNLIGLFNCGLEVARGEFVSLIRPGVELQEDWDTAISDAFADEDVGSVTPAIVSSSNQQAW